jgi:hypothetical protein
MNNHFNSAMFHSVKCHFGECYFGECHFGEGHFGECHFGECLFGECHIMCNILCVSFYVYHSDEHSSKCQLNVCHSDEIYKCYSAFCQSTMCHSAGLNYFFAFSQTSFYFLSI